MASKIRLDITTTLPEAERDLKNFGIASEKAAKKALKFQKSFKTEKINNFIVKTQRASMAVKAVKSPLEAARLSQAKYLREMQRLITAGLNPQSKAIKKLAKEHKNATKKVDKFTKKAEKQAKVLERNAKIARIASRALLAVGVAAVAAGIGMIKAASSVEDATAAFTPLLGTVEKAELLVRRLNETAAETPFQFSGLSEISKTILPAMNGSIEDTIATVKMLGDTAGGNMQKLQSIASGYSKVLLKGKVDMERLNQISDAGVPIFSELAKSMGVGVDELFKLSSQGKITSSDLTKSFEIMTSEGGIFFKGMEIASKTLTGRISTLKDNIFLLAATIGKKLLPIAKQYVDIIIEWVASVKSFIEGSEKINKSLLLISTGFDLLLNNIKNFSSQWIATVALLTTQTISFWSNAFKQMNKDVISLGITIIDDLIGSIQVFIDLARNIPFVGDQFKNIATGVDVFRASLMAADIVNQNSTENTLELSKQKIEAAEKERDAILLALESENIARQDAILKKQELAMIDLEILAAYNEGKNEIDAEQKEKELENEIAHSDAKGALLLQAQTSFQQAMTDLNAKFGKKTLEDNIKANKLKLKEAQTFRALINKNDKLSAADKELILTQLDNSDRMRKKLKFQYDLDIANKRLNSAKNLTSNLIQLSKNMGKETAKLAKIQKAIAIATAIVNVARGITLALASYPPPVSFAMAAAVGIAGAIEVATIASTKIPTAETGGSFEIPQSRVSSRADQIGVMASPGETVSVTPRGEEEDKNVTVNVVVNQEVIWTMVQDGIDANEITITDDNIRGAVA